MRFIVLNGFLLISLTACQFGKFTSLNLLVEETPTITSVTAPASGTYESEFSFEVNLSTPVVVDGSPRLPITIGQDTKYADFVPEFSTETKLIFSYSVSNIDYDDDGIAVQTNIDLNGSEIKSLSGKDALLTFNSINTSSIRVGKRKLYFDFASQEYSLAGKSESEITNYPGFSFSRNSVSYAQTSSGAWQAFPVNTPRITSRGLLIEGSRTNKFQNDNANPTNGFDLTWMGEIGTDAGVVDDSAEILNSGLAQIASLGTVYIADNTVGVLPAYISFAGTTGSTAVHTVSIFVRGGTGGIETDSSVNLVSFPASSSYQRISATFTPASTTTGIQFRVDAGQIVYLILNQLEQGTNASSPIVTSGGSQATRPADLATFTGLNITAEPMTIVSHQDFEAQNGINRYFYEFTNGTSADRLFAFRSMTDRSAFQSYSGNTLVFQPSRSGYSGAQNYKIAAKFDGTSYKWAIANLLGAPTNGPFPTAPLNTLYLGTNYTQDRPLNGYLKKLEMFNEAKSDADLQALSN